MATAKTLNTIDTADHAHALAWALKHQGACVYVAGPMAGLPDHGFPAFHTAEAKLWDMGLVPLSPARGAPPPDVIEREEEKYGDFRESPLYGTMMRRDFGYVCMAQALFMLPGWQHSRGASKEYDVGRIIGNTIFDGAWLLQ